jgi:hypothetical protein
MVSSMSSLLRPIGHLPPSVYWVRRALLGVLLLVLVVVLLRVLGGDPKPAASTGPLSTPTPATTLSVRSSIAGPPGTSSSGDSGSTSTSVGTPGGTPTPGADTRSTTAPRRADGRCTGTSVQVSVVPVARRVSAGRPLNVQVNLSTNRADGCAATIDPGQLVVTVTSGKDRIWSTAHCGRAIPRATLALSAGKPSTTTVTWDGRRSAANCPANQSMARPGTYVVQATYAGQASTEQAFHVV